LFFFRLRLLRIAENFEKNGAYTTIFVVQFSVVCAIADQALFLPRIGKESPHKSVPIVELYWGSTPPHTR